MAQAPERYRYALPDANGIPQFQSMLTETDRDDIVKLVVKPCILPVVFVPGIMGSNLRAVDTKERVWRLDSTFGLPLGLLWSMLFKGPGARQSTLHPDRVEVDPDGDVPNNVASIGKKEKIKARGWGEISESSYKLYLLWLEEHLNQVPPNPARWTDFKRADGTIGPVPRPGEELLLTPGIQMAMEGQPFNAELPDPEHPEFKALMSDELIARSRFQMPVHAVGYNWLAGCSQAAKSTLKPAIERIIAQYDVDPFWCKQVIIVTHSMGGLVARACARLPGMADKIAGIVHGVMPAIGAPVAYRRCKVGMRDEDFGAGLVIGSNGREVTAVFAQAPGALTLLPNKTYPVPWLTVAQDDATFRSWPKPYSYSNSYRDIYQNTEQWWGLVQQEWLKPRGGMPIDKDDFLLNLLIAEVFHRVVADYYHGNTYVFYGIDEIDPSVKEKDRKHSSFATITWRMTPGLRETSAPRMTIDDVVASSQQNVRADGSSLAFIGKGGRHRADDPGTGMPYSYTTSDWEVRCQMQDGSGDGTVPASSGEVPRLRGGGNVKQQFHLIGVQHEPAFKNAMAQRISLYAMTKISAAAKTT